MTVPYTLQYYGSSASNTPVDISDYVEAIDKFTDSGTGEVSSVKIMLETRFGDFVASNRGGRAPIIETYDLFKLEITDRGNSYERWLIQDDIAPQKNEFGTHVTLELFGRERYLQKMLFPGHFRFIHFSDMIRTIVKFYNDNRGSKQPEMVVSTSQLEFIPEHAFGTFEFGRQVLVYDALMDVVNRLALPVQSGGDGRHYGMFVSDKLDSGSRMLLQIVPLGALPTTIRTTLTKPLTISLVKRPEDGNIVVVRGQKSTGSYPPQIAEYRSLIEEFENLPRWEADVVYPVDTYVRGPDGLVYQAIIETAAGTAPISGIYWNRVTLDDYVEEWTGESSYKYSPWTENRANVFKSYAGNPTGGLDQNFDSVAFPDSNLVIRDTRVWRDWVDFRVRSISDIPSQYLYAATADHPASDIQGRTYHGMRVLVDNTSTAGLGAAGEPFHDGSGWKTDKEGKSYENAFVMQDRDGDWLVFHNAEGRNECAVRHEGKLYQYTEPLTEQTIGQRPRSVHTNNPGGGGLGWRDVSQTIFGNDCFHYPRVVENVDGLLSNARSNSAVKVEYVFGQSTLVGEEIYNSISGGPWKFVSTVFDLIKAAVDGEYQGVPIENLSDDTYDALYNHNEYNQGWWLTVFEAPSPLAHYTGEITEDVGGIYGGTADNKIPVLDLSNLNQTPSGKTGYGHADSDQLGELDGISMLMNFSIEGADISAFQGDLPFSCTIYDLLGNVWKASTTHRFQKETYELRLPLNAFKIYRARTQGGFTPSREIQRLIDPELKITDVFDRHLVKRIVLQLDTSYDDQGRYDPGVWTLAYRQLISQSLGVGLRFSGTIDALHFTKTPLAIARDDTSLAEAHLMGKIREYPNISNVVQLQKIADAELERAKLNRESWSATYDGMLDIKAGQQVYVKDSDFIPASEAPGGEGSTRRLIVKKITYSVGSKSSHSGLITTVELYRRVP